MFIVVVHAVSNPRFWAVAKESMATIPAGLRLHSVYPSADGAKGSCLWEAPSVDAVKAFIEPGVAGLATNEYFVVDAAHAFGLPG